MWKQTVTNVINNIWKQLVNNYLTAEQTDNQLIINNKSFQDLKKNKNDKMQQHFINISES